MIQCISTSWYDSFHYIVPLDEYVHRHVYLGIYIYIYKAYRNKSICDNILLFSVLIRGGVKSKGGLGTYRSWKGQDSPRSEKKGKEGKKSHTKAAFTDFKIEPVASSVPQRRVHHVLCQCPITKPPSVQKKEKATSCLSNYCLTLAE